LHRFTCEIFYRGGRHINFIIFSPSDGGSIVGDVNGAEKLKIVAQRTVEFVCQDDRRKVDPCWKWRIEVPDPSYSDGKLIVRLN